MKSKLILVLMIFRSYMYVEGAIQLYAGSEPTLAGFQLVCDVSPGAITGAVTFFNPQGNNAGACNFAFSCGSAASNTVTQDRSINSTYITIVDANIVDESSVKGEWKCTHNIETATLEVTHLLCNSSLEITKPVSGGPIKTGDQVEFTHNCVCPDSSYVVEYVPENYPNETDVTSIPNSEIELTSSGASPSCRNNASKTITGKFTVSNNRPTATTKIKITAQIVGALTSNKPTVLSDFKVEGASKIDKCACTVTTVLGGVLGIPFTLLFDTVFMLVIYFAKDKEIIKKCKDKIVLTIVAVCIGVVLSCGIGAGVTSAVMSGKDTGYKSTGCKCAEYIGVLISLGFSVLGSSVTSVIIYMFVFSRKEDGSVSNGSKRGPPEGTEDNRSKRGPPEGTEDKSKRGPPEGTEDKSKSEKPTTIPEDDKPMATQRDLPPIQKSESILATMPPRQLPLPPINHQI